MPIDYGYSSESSNRQMCVDFFIDLFSPNELKEKIRHFSPEKIKKRSKKTERTSLSEWLGIDKIEDHKTLADIFYDVVGPHFLYEVQGAKPNDTHSNSIRYEIVRKAIDKRWFSEQTVFKEVNSLPHRKKQISKLDEIMELSVPGPWVDSLYRLFASHLPIEVKEAPSRSESKKKPIETITAIRELRPLHDYQIFAGKKIRDLIESPKGTNKRQLISIPTGAGKTRLVAESLIDWINDGKPSEDSKIHDSKYMIWIAQSRELCEQAISQFQEIYVQKGKSALTVFRLFGSHNITLSTILSQKVEHGLIVCTINKIYEQIENKEKITDYQKDFFQNNLDYDDKVQKSEIPKRFYQDHHFGSLRSMTSCVVVDEAHKAIMPMYTCVLRGLGFNFSYKKEEDVNEFGITLVGLTATAFRGTGLEPSREGEIKQDNEDKTQIIFEDNGGWELFELKSPVHCSVCENILSKGDKILQSTSNKKLVWHFSEEQISAETRRIYTRFSQPLVPKIYAFDENQRPKAIITCNEKFVADDPVRISGEKSYDLLGEIKKFSWSIERRHNLTEVFGIVPSQISKPKNLPALETIVEEIKEPGTYMITLTVENIDGIKDVATKTVEVISKEASDTANDMQELIQNLIKRGILCNVFHTSVKSGMFEIEGDEKIEIGTQMRNQAAQNDERNQKLVEIINYMLSAPKEQRKKILVFACDILHARVLQLVLRTKYHIDVDYVDSDLHESRNISRIQKFRKKSEESKKGKVLINTNMLTTGFDVPDVDCVIMGRPVLSTVEYTQMIGRGMRGLRMGGTKEVWIVDFDDQVQLHEQKQKKFIRLGWKSMAYDKGNNLIWKPLSDKSDIVGKPLDLEINIQDDNQLSPKSEEISLTCNSCKTLSHGIDEISINYALSSEEKEELERLCNEGTYPRLQSLKLCKTCKGANERWHDSSDPWKFLVLKEKNDPLLLHFVKQIASSDSRGIRVDISDFLEPKKILQELFEKRESDDGLDNSFESLNEAELEIFRELQRSAIEKISREHLGQFYKDYVILQKEMKSKIKLVALCNDLINPDILEKQIFAISSHRKKNLSPDQKLRNETERIIFEELAYIPEEDEFHMLIGDEMYDFMINKYVTYQNFQSQIQISNYIVKLRKRSECLEKIMVYYNSTKKEPDFATLEKIIPYFKDTLDENFKDTNEFISLTKKMINSAISSPNMPKFEDLKKDYDFVDELEPQKPTVESMLHRSKIGIGSYMKYAGTIENFEDISYLNKENREELEILIKQFKEIKVQINGIPDEKLLSDHSNYKQVIESLWFDNYSKFLEIVGEDPNHILKASSKIKDSDKNEMIRNARKFANSNGMQELFKRIMKESEIKYTLNFGSRENFILQVFSDNKQVALSKWEDAKKQFDLSLP